MSAITTSEPQEFSMVASNFQDAWKYAEIIANSQLCPKDFKGKPGDVLLAMQLGQEVGLKPLQAIQNIAVINGRPTMWGDAVWAIVLSQSDLESAIEYSDGDGDNKTAYCVITKKGKQAIIGKFSVSDAKKASLFNKQGPWTQYPDRMLQMRARAFAARDAYANALKGIAISEEILDYPAERVVNTAENLTAKLEAKIQSNKSQIETKPIENSTLMEHYFSKDMVINAINDSKSLDELKQANDYLPKMRPEDKPAAKAAYLERKKYLLSQNEGDGKVDGEWISDFDKTTTTGE